jgi:hypothetical protein
VLARPDRVHILGRSKFRLAVIDRQGLLRSMTFDRGNGGRIADSLAPVLVILGLALQKGKWLIMIPP